jgi:hypothetical protein
MSSGSYIRVHCANTYAYFRSLLLWGGGGGGRKYLKFYIGPGFNTGVFFLSIPPQTPQNPH